MSNLALWEAVEKTDPNHTKPITGKSYQGTSPKPYYLVRKATEAFGPIGVGWGFTIENERIEEGSGGEKLHIARVKVWFKWNGERGEVEHVGGTVFSGTRSSGKPFTDEDAPKKSVTDALVKALSMIGFAGDIFMGRYDDSKYVQELRNEERANGNGNGRAPRKQEDISLAKQLRDSLHVAVQEIIAGFTTLADLEAYERDTYPAQRERLSEGKAWTADEWLEAKRLELAGEPARVSDEQRMDYVRGCLSIIEEARTRKELGDWWKGQGPTRRKMDLSHEQLAGLKKAVEEKRDSLPMPGRSDAPYAGSQAKPTGIDLLPAG